MSESSIPIRKVLIVGGAGFLGLHLVDAFYNLPEKPRIYVFDVRPLPTDLSSTVYRFDKNDIVSLIGDLTSESDVSDAIRKASPDLIVHSASPVHGMGASVYQKVNVKGTEILVKCAQDLSVPALVYTSSAGTVFNGTDLRNADESWPFPQPAMDAYNETKAIGETIVLSASSHRLRTTAIRPAGIFGPGDRQMIPSLRKLGESGQHRYQLGDNLNLFDVTYVTNVADAHVLAAKKLMDPSTAAGVAGEAFFITNDSPIYFWSLGKAIWQADGHTSSGKIVIPFHLAVFFGHVGEFIAKMTGKEANLTPFRVKTACAARYYNIDKAKKYLGYAPRVGLQEAIFRTLQAMDEAKK